MTKHLLSACLQEVHKVRKDGGHRPWSRGCLVATAVTDDQRCAPNRTEGIQQGFLGGGTLRCVLNKEREGQSVGEPGAGLV